MNSPTELFLLLIPLFFFGLWVTVGFIVSRLGWHGFAQRYAASARPPGPSFNCRSAWFSSLLASYRNVVRVVFSEAGVYFYPMFLFRAFHPPFLVPWDKVVGVASKAWFLGTWQVLEVRDGTAVIHLVLGDAALRELKKFKNL